MTQVTLLLSGVASLVWGFRAALFPGQCDLGGESPRSQSLHPSHLCLFCSFLSLENARLPLYSTVSCFHCDTPASLGQLGSPVPPLPFPPSTTIFSFSQCYTTIELGWKSLPTWPAWRGPPTSLPSPSPGHTMALLT